MSDKARRLGPVLGRIGEEPLPAGPYAWTVRTWLILEDGTRGLCFTNEKITVGLAVIYYLTSRVGSR
jgi:hypothetical protein